MTREQIYPRNTSHSHRSDIHQFGRYCYRDSRRRIIHQSIRLILAWLLVSVILDFLFYNNIIKIGHLNKFDTVWPVNVIRYLLDARISVIDQRGKVDDDMIV